MPNIRVANFEVVFELPRHGHVQTEVLLDVLVGQS